MPIFLSTYDPAWREKLTAVERQLTSHDALHYTDAEKNRLGELYRRTLMSAFETTNDYASCRRKAAAIYAGLIGKGFEVPEFPQDVSIKRIDQFAAKIFKIIDAHAQGISRGPD